MSEKIEERLAHLERLADDLNDVVTDQAARIAHLERRVAVLMEHEAEREADGGGGAVLGDERPPHY